VNVCVYMRVASVCVRAHTRVRACARECVCARACPQRHRAAACRRAVHETIISSIDLHEVQGFVVIKAVGVMRHSPAFARCPGPPACANCRGGLGGEGGRGDGGR